MHPMRRRLGFSSAFTLIELLVVIAIIAILAVVVVLTLNPAQLLAQSRDATRVSDMATLNTAIGLYQTDMGGIGTMGSSSVVYTSLADNNSSTCGSLGLPALPSSTIYDCSANTSTRLVNNQGWIPLDFTKISSGAPFGSLPIDPVNQSSSGLYYAYAASGTQYMVSAIPESQKQKAALGQKPMVPNYPDVIANGNSLTINPLYNPVGLVGYWTFDEAAGSTTQDMSGNNNVGTWTGTPAGANGTYYGTGKIGSSAAYFNGSNDYISVPNGNYLNTNQFTVSAWLNITAAAGIYTGGVVWKYNYNANGLQIPVGSYSTPYVAYVPIRGGTTGNPAGQTGVGAFTAPFNAWNLFTFVATYDGTATYLTTYLNGVSLGQQPWGTGTFIPNANALEIGDKGGGGFNQYFNGSMDDYRLYNRALSAAEVGAMYNAGK